MYRSMTLDRSGAQPPARAAWDRELGTPLEDVQWSCICKLTKSVSCKSRFKLTHFNFIHRTCITPVTLHKMDSNRSTECPCCKHLTASFVHLAFSCSQVLEFWTKVLDRLQPLFHINCEELKPTFCLLGDIPKKKGQRLLHTFLHLVLLLAKRRVAIAWMGDLSPSLERWERDVTEWSVAEEVRMKMCRTDDKLVEDLEVWGSLISESLDPLVIESTGSDTFQRDSE